VRIPRWAVLAVVALLVAAAACSSGDDDGGDSGGAGGDGAGGGGEASVEELMATLGTGVVVPAYAELVDTLDALGTAVDELCTTPSPAALDATRAAWGTAADAWQRTRPVGVGPAMDRRVMSTVAYPARPEDVDELLAGTDPITAESLAEGRATARGLGTVERLLFEPEVADQALAASPPGGRRCTYAAAAVALAATSAGEVADDWAGAGGEPYTDVLVAGIDGDPQSSLAAIVNELAHALQTIDDQGLRGIAVADSPDDVPETQRDGPAGRRVADLRALLATVQAVVEGPGGDDGLGALVAARSAETGERLDEALAAAVETVGALPDSISATLAVPDDLAAAAEDAGELKVVLSTEVASVLGITIGFSDADGDS
jgi:predicted lipoprotein